MTKRLTSTLLAAIAVMVPGLASANNHDDKGFYIGAGAHLTGSEMKFTKTFTDLTLNITNGAGSVSGNPVTFTDENLDFGPAAVSFNADEDSDVGYGVHAGYKINKFFAVEVGYSILGEFSSNSAVTLGSSDPDLTLPGGATFDTDGSTLAYRYSVEAEAFTGALLGTYSLADNATVFGKLGYYVSDISEDRTLSLTKGTDALTGKLSYNGKGLLEDASGLMYGAGMEVKFGRNHNILVRGEFNLLADGLGEVDDITQFGLTASWVF